MDTNKATELTNTFMFYCENCGKNLGINCKYLTELVEIKTLGSIQTFKYMIS
jgi:hypothetical protein